MVQLMFHIGWYKVFYNIICKMHQHNHRFHYNTDLIKSTVSTVALFNKIHVNSYTADSPIADQPVAIKIPLMMHQRTLLAGLIDAEKESTTGTIVGELQLFSKIGIISDKVGSGKSLTCLALAATNTEIKDGSTHMDYYFNQDYYTLRTASTPIKIIPSKSNLIIVPHSLIKQWSQYIQEQTTLSFHTIRLSKDASSSELLNRIVNTDITLITNTMFPVMMNNPNVASYHWRRVFIDEADTIEINRSLKWSLKYSFIWLISASFMNLMFPTGFHSFDKIVTTNMPNFEKHLCESSLCELRKNIGVITSITGCYSSYIQKLINISETSGVRWKLVHRNTIEYVNNSFTLPELRKTIIKCLPSAKHALVKDLLGDDIGQLLNADDIAGVYKMLGLIPKEQNDIIDAVTQHFAREINNLQAKLTYRQATEYVDKGTKEAAIAKVQDEIKRIETRVETLTQRVKSYKEETCGICLDIYKCPVMTKCCGTVICLECLRQTVIANPKCPMCRADLKNISSDVHFITDKNEIGESEKNEDTRLSKVDAFINLCKTHPEGRFLVFSDYDGSFTELSTRCDAADIGWSVLSGNMNIISHSLNGFDTGKYRVLFLNARFIGAGLNLLTTSHIVIYHKLNSATENQVIGRAYRMGRTKPLDVIYLMNPNEIEEVSI